MSTFVNISNLPFLIEKRSKLLGLPVSITRPAISDFNRWCVCSGPDFAVGRMKVIKQIILNYASTGSEIPKDLWVKKKNRHILYGHFGELQKLAASSSKMLQKVMTFLNMYTVITQPETTPAMLEKLRVTVEGPSPNFPHREKLEEQMTLATKWAVKTYGLNNSDVDYAGLYELTSEMKPHQEAEFLHQAERLFRTKVGIDLIDSPVIFKPLINVLGFRGYKYYGCPPFMGRVFRIPSPGLKDRWVCDFSKPLDHCLKPMGKRIYDAVAKLPWDITFDESKCYRDIQSHLKQGKVAYAFDLSSATDRFPWWVQHSVLKAFSNGKVYQEMVSLYDTVIHLPAEMPDGSELYWKVGQPLGAYPSFATFTFTHGILLFWLCNGKYDGQFFVHGDDVVILDDALAAKYKQIITNLGVPISEFKTLKSNKYTEINSKIISADRIATIPKWKPITRKNVLSQLKNWGPRVLDFLRVSDDERQATMRLASLPVCLGGAGVNPLGIPLEDRINGLEDILFKEKELSYEGSARSRVLSRYLANSNFFNLLDNAMRSAERADQARLESMPIKVYGDSRDLDILGKNLYSVNPDLRTPISGSRRADDVRDQVSEITEKIRKSNAFD